MHVAQGMRRGVHRVPGSIVPVLQAANDACRARGHILAEGLAVLEAGISQRYVEADVGGGILHDLLHTRGAAWVLDLLPVLEHLFAISMNRAPQSDMAAVA